VGSQPTRKRVVSPPDKTAAPLVKGRGNAK